MSEQLTPKEKDRLEMQEFHYRVRLREHQFFNALIGRYPVLHPAIGVLIGLAMLLLALLLFSAVHPRSRYQAFLLISVGAVFVVFSTLLLLMGLVDWGWNQARLIFR